MFKCELDDINLLKSSFESISSIVDEVQIQTDSEGLRLNALDKSHITFVGLNMDCTVFSEYVCDEPQKINVDTGELLKILKRAKRGDTLTLSVDEANLVLTFTGEAKRTFKVRLIDIEYDSPQPPQINNPVSITIPYTLFKDSCSDVSVYSDKIYISVGENKVMFGATGGFGDTNIEYWHMENVKDSVSSIYSLEKVQEMLKADKISDYVTIGVGNDTPLTMTLQTLSEEVTLNYLLAPRIESDY